MKKLEHDKLKKKILSRWSHEFNALQEAYYNHPIERYDRMGIPIGYAEWLILTRDIQYYIVGKEKIDDIEIFTLWEGYPGHGYEVSIIKEKTIISLATCNDEKTALKLHGHMIFLVDQKMWENYV
jgi:hypothetical protein